MECNACSTCKGRGGTWALLTPPMRGSIGLDIRRDVFTSQALRPRAEAGDGQQTPALKYFGRVFWYQGVFPPVQLVPWLRETHVVVTQANAGMPLPRTATACILSSHSMDSNDAPRYPADQVRLLFPEVTVSESILAGGSYIHVGSAGRMLAANLQTL